jgi:hypothetical protein
MAKTLIANLTQTPIRKILLVALLSFTVIWVLGCSKNDFPTYNQLGGLRVLALVVDQPEVSPSATVNITPVLSDLRGAGRTLNYSVRACIDPGIGVGAAVACKTSDAGNTLTGSLTIPAGASQTYTGAVASFAITTPDNATMLASRTPADQFNGVAYLVFYTLTAADGSTVNSYVRVIVSAASKVTKNTNPVITSINVNGTAAASPLAMPTSASNFSVTSPATSSQTYQTMTQTGSLVTRTEQLFNTWFITDGTFDFQRTYDVGLNSWAPPGAKPAARGLVILVVTHDGNNGMAFQKLELN